MKLATILALGLSLTSAAHGQEVFRCVGANGKLEYSDTGCSTTAKSGQVIAIKQNQLDTGYQSQASAPRNAYQSGLDGAVAGALADRDYRKAKELAVTTEQFDKIREAEMAERQLKAAQDDKKRARRVEVVKMLQQQANHDQQMRSLNQIENNTATWNRPIQPIVQQPKAPNYNCQQTMVGVGNPQFRCSPSPY